jgi:hypothetical protein
VSAAHLPTAVQDFQQQHQGVVKALDTALELGTLGVFNAATCNTQVKETLTALIKKTGTPRSRLLVSQAKRPERK